MPTITPATILAVAAVIVIATVSVLLISKIGGKRAKRNIRELHGIKDDEKT